MRKCKTRAEENGVEKSKMIKNKVEFGEEEECSEAGINGMTDVTNFRSSLRSMPR